MLKRHLMTHYQMTPDEYRQKWGLNADYPMVAPNYAEQRRPWPRRSASAPSAAAPPRNKLGTGRERALPTGHLYPAVISSKSVLR